MVGGALGELGPVARDGDDDDGDAPVEDVGGGGSGDIGIVLFAVGQERENEDRQRHAGAHDDPLPEGRVDPDGSTLARRSPTPVGTVR